MRRSLVKCPYIRDDDVNCTHPLWGEHPTGHSHSIETPLYNAIARRWLLAVATACCACNTLWTYLVVVQSGVCDITPRPLLPPTSSSVTFTLTAGILKRAKNWLTLTVTLIVTMNRYLSKFFYHRRALADRRHSVFGLLVCPCVIIYWKLLNNDMWRTACGNFTKFTTSVKFVKKSSGGRAPKAPRGNGVGRVSPSPPEEGHGEGLWKNIKKISEEGWAGSGAESRAPTHFWHIWRPHNTSGRENSVTLLNNVQSPKSDSFI